jgi:hypothetical protein
MYGKTHTHLVDPDSFFPVQATLLASPPALFGATTHAKDDVARFPIWTFVALALEHDFVALGRTGGYLEGELRRVVEHLVAGARGALSDDHAAAPTASVARHLRLREHTGEDLLFDHAHAAPAALGTWVDVAVRGGA